MKIKANLQAKNLLSLYQVSRKRQNWFVVGCFEKRITLHSQQIRAFNLAWALIEETRLTSERSIAVVGGGLAGITLAAALAIKGIQVTLYEKNSDVLHLQRGNRIRYLHPNLYDWPASGSLKIDTQELPFLSWRAGYSDEVSNQILLQWETMASKVEIRCHHEVTKATIVGQKTILEFDNDASRQRAHDVVVFCVGFGIEKALPELPQRSYWQNDALNQPTLIDKSRSYLVTGCGDGGLTDALRLCLQDFDHEAFLIDLARSYSDLKLQTALSSIDANAIKLFSDLTKKRRPKSEVDEAVRGFLSVEYNNLSLPERLTSDLRRLARADTRVTINNKAFSFLTLESSILNRLAAHTLVKIGVLRYIPGEPRVAKTTDGKFFVVFKTDNVPVNPNDPLLSVYAFDEIVVRQGTESSIKPFLEKSDFKKLTSRVRSDIFDKSLVPAYPQDYWHNEYSAAKRSSSKTDFVFLHHADCLLIAPRTRSEKIMSLAEEIIKAIAAAASLRFELMENDSFQSVIGISSYVRFTLQNDTDVAVCNATLNTHSEPGEEFKHSVTLTVQTSSKALIGTILSQDLLLCTCYEIEPKASSMSEFKNRVQVSHKDLSMTIFNSEKARPTISIYRAEGLRDPQEHATLSRCLKVIKTNDQAAWNELYNAVTNFEN